ncbi:hypothetical protein ATE69_14970 [Sphingopyxis sp. H071]|nr:hypothetical protein ATE61_17470 [Sphingopyxis sp. H057]KTE52220.1 hypothetical protein ATE64_11050 [Sphingopyxis sp. H073]KTE52406.1 hypothetical protein ATE69_14970 [Sphingopyxis sp. H071]KTE53359.1 hypothetical protein ATE66_20305 [Sphingopyxis sp. H107]KTE64723.1 hypothetical protein ATE65_11725 [Sphingopyxis sp. H100]KTE70607.1 hypothetical protein ATE60_14950 [Sphingopyxis sp. H081]KTE79648.1 hypothetical protein ATE63_15140 [Sphingopyxis sp. H067]
MAAAPTTILHAAAPTTTASSAESEMIARQRAATEKLLKELDRQTGTIPIQAAKADLNLGDQYYFVGPEQSRTILVDIWRNPPASANGVLGMVFPKGKSFIDDTWSAVITYEGTGYVSDDDAKTIDYEEMLANMKASDEAQAADIRAQGYPAGILQRWAQAPTYDAGRHSLVWARDIKFDDTPEDTLNYDIRLLGREGVLSMNILASMSQLDDVRQAAKTFASVGSFHTGARYADYNASTDKKAEYGLAGLVAAGGAAAVAKKVGLLAILAKFGKFLLIGLVALFAGFRNFIGGLFGRKPAMDASEWEALADEDKRD